MASSE